MPRTAPITMAMVTHGLIAPRLEKRKHGYAFVVLPYQGKIGERTWEKSETPACVAQWESAKGFSGKSKLRYLCKIKKGRKSRSHPGKVTATQKIFFPTKAYVAKKKGKNFPIRRENTWTKAEIMQYLKKHPKLVMGDVLPKYAKNPIERKTALLVGGGILVGLGGYFLWKRAQKHPLVTILMTIDAKNDNMRVSLLGETSEPTSVDFYAVVQRGVELLKKYDVVNFGLAVTHDTIQSRGGNWAYDALVEYGNAISDIVRSYNIPEHSYTVTIDDPRAKE